MALTFFLGWLGRRQAWHVDRQRDIDIVQWLTGSEHTHYLFEIALAWVTLLAEGEALERSGCADVFNQLIYRFARVVKNFGLSAEFGRGYNLKAVDLRETIEPMGERTSCAFLGVDLVATWTGAVQRASCEGGDFPSHNELNRGGIVNVSVELHQYQHSSCITCIGDLPPDRSAIHATVLSDRCLPPLRTFSVRTGRLGSVAGLRRFDPDACKGFEELEELDGFGKITDGISIECLKYHYFFDAGLAAPHEVELSKMNIEAKILRYG